MREFKSKPKQLFNYVRSKQKVKLGVSRLERGDGHLTDTDEETANVLNKFFELVFTQKPEGDVPVRHARNGNTALRDCEFIIGDVKEQMTKLKHDKPPGPDGIHPCVLNLCADEMAKPMFIIYKKSLEEGRLPREWKSARVDPIFKKGSKNPLATIGQSA